MILILESTLTLSYVVVIWGYFLYFSATYYLYTRGTQNFLCIDGKDKLPKVIR